MATRPESPRPVDKLVDELPHPAHSLWMNCQLNRMTPGEIRYFSLKSADWRMNLMSGLTFARAGSKPIELSDTVHNTLTCLSDKPPCASQRDRESDARNPQKRMAAPAPMNDVGSGSVAVGAPVPEASPRMTTPALRLTRRFSVNHW